MNDFIFVDNRIPKDFDLRNLAEIETIKNLNTNLSLVLGATNDEFYRFNNSFVFLDKKEMNNNYNHRPYLRMDFNNAKHFKFITTPNTNHSLNSKFSLIVVDRATVEKTHWNSKILSCLCKLLKPTGVMYIEKSVINVPHEQSVYMKMAQNTFIQSNYEIQPNDVISKFNAALLIKSGFKQVYEVNKYGILNNLILGTTPFISFCVKKNIDYKNEIVKVPTQKIFTYDKYKISKVGNYPINDHKFVPYYMATNQNIKIML